MPSDDDVLKARLKTVGVSEYKFEMEVAAGRDSGTEWRIVDVGGSRSQRRGCHFHMLHMHKLIPIEATWAPFFDDGTHTCITLRLFDLTVYLVDAIIFLAPISGFDQPLAEDKMVNRLVS